MRRHEYAIVSETEIGTWSVRICFSKRKAMREYREAVDYSSHRQGWGRWEISLWRDDDLMRRTCIYPGGSFEEKSAYRGEPLKAHAR